MIPFILPLVFTAGALAAQLPDAPYEETPPEVVERMLHLADLHPGDVVYDLGCGDGRIVIAAVRRRGVRGVCVELDPARLKWAREVAEEAGVAGLIQFVRGDLFEVPIQDATVVTLYLMRPANLRLKPRLLRELRPGSRVVSYRFDMGNWEAERTEKAGDREIYRWTIPESGAVR
jgi:ubiquinone/menaquinone biosynthesis C-methylase UbiE